MAKSQHLRAKASSSEHRSVNAAASFKRRNVICDTLPKRRRERRNSGREGERENARMCDHGSASIREGEAMKRRERQGNTGARQGGRTMTARAGQRAVRGSALGADKIMDAEFFRKFSGR